MYIDRSRLTATQVCYLLNISPPTLARWYKYYNETPKHEIPHDCPGLPDYYQDSKHGKRIWQNSDLPQLFAFQQWIPRGKGGIMQKYSRKCWDKEYVRQLEEMEKNQTFTKKRLKAVYDKKGKYRY